MTPVLLFRSDRSTEDELIAAKKYFPVVQQRALIPKGSLVIPRYSALPYYKELEQDVSIIGSKMVNSYEQHKYVANMEYIKDIEDLTPKTYSSWAGLPEGPYVIKGKTNSRKHEWNKRMFAPNLAAIPAIANSLLDDALIQEQGLVVREYIPLETFDIGINGLPITNEWRFFCLNGKIVDWGFYWANFPDIKPKCEEAAIYLVNEVLSRISVPFVVVDVAKTKEGKWIVIELNDAQMSGLSTIDPNSFYYYLYMASGDGK